MASRRILVVDDEIDVREIVKSILERAGHSVAAASSAEGAVELLATADFDLICTDYKMPGMDGIDLARKVKLGRRIPVLLMTGYADTSDITRLERLGEVALIKKPFRRTEILAAVESILKSPEACAKSGSAQAAKLTAEQQRALHAAKMSSLGEMVAGIAHEINNPLSVIAANAGYLHHLAQEENFDRETLMKLATRIEETSMRVAKIIKGLKSFSRNCEGDPFVEASLAEIIDDTLALCSEKIRNSGISLITSPLAPDLRIECRPVQVSQVLLNLLNNAFHAVKSLEAPWIRLEFSDLGNRIELSITDRGSGIDPSLGDRIFQPFYTTKLSGEGSGIGLSVSRRIAQSHKGTIEIDRLSPNTRFVLTLPKSQSQSQSQSMPRTPH